MERADSVFHVFPRQARSRILLEIRLPARQFLLLPIVDWDGIRIRGKVIPQIFDELKLLGGP